MNKILTVMLAGGLTPENVADMRNDGLYVNIKSKAYRKGEIRGQIFHEGKCSDNEKSSASCKVGKGQTESEIKVKVEKYGWFGFLDFCYDGENCVTKITNRRGKAKATFKNVPSGDRLVTVHYSCGETKSFSVRCK